MGKYVVTLKYPDVTKVIIADNSDEAMEIAQEITDSDFFNAHEWDEADITELKEE